VNDGKIWLHRKILDSDLWGLCSRHIAVAEVCLLKANWEDRPVRGIMVKRTQWITHHAEIARLCPPDVTEKVVRTALAHLKRLGFLGTQVVIQSGRRYLLITICKYNEYQNPGIGSGRRLGTRLGINRADGGQMVGTTLTEGIKEVEEDKNKDTTLSAGDHPTGEEFAAYWNTKSQLTKSRTWGPERERKLRGLRARADFRENWMPAIDALCLDEYAIGKGWATIDIFLSNDSHKNSNWNKAWEKYGRQLRPKPISQPAKPLSPPVSLAELERTRGPIVKSGKEIA
jgi:hypothetical protein